MWKQDKNPRHRGKWPDIVENTTSVSCVSVTLKTGKIWPRRWTEQPKRGNRTKIHDIMENSPTSWKTRLASHVSVKLKTYKIWARRWTKRPKRGNWAKIHDIVENGTTSWKTRLASHVCRLRSKQAKSGRDVGPNSQNVETGQKSTTSWKTARHRGKRD